MRFWGGRGVVGERLRASGVQMGLKSYFFAGGTEVLCVRRWEEVWVETNDRTEGFRCDA